MNLQDFAELSGIAADVAIVLSAAAAIRWPPRFLRRKRRRATRRWKTRRHQATTPATSSRARRSGRVSGGELVQQRVDRPKRRRFRKQSTSEYAS